MSRGGYRWGQRRMSVENCHSITAWGRFQWSQTEYDEGFECNWEVKDGWLILNHKRDGIEHTTQIPLISTPCNYGGSRFWFICHCGRRVGKLYLPAHPNAWQWLCRHCYGLTYEQRRSGSDGVYGSYLSWRADRLLIRHGITVGDQGFFHKPKGMRYKTFERLMNKHDALVKRDNALFLRSLYSG